MSARNVQVGEGESLVEAAEIKQQMPDDPQHEQQVSEAIKDKQQQTNLSKRASHATYLAILQWILLIFCVSSNIYLLSKPVVKCECDPSAAQSQIISLIPTLNPSTVHHPTVSPVIIPSSSAQPTIGQTVAPTLHPSSQPNPGPNPTGSPSLPPSSPPTDGPTEAPSSHPSIQPTKQPNSNPSVQPSMTPTSYPSTNDPTRHPSEYPSQSPTYFDGFFVGDYKYSFRNSSHGFWLLCHGQWLDSTKYSMLYEEMGYLFGLAHDPSGTIAYFRLPDARDAVMGIIGSGHGISEEVGNETHVLSESEMAQHAHYFGSGASNGNCYGNMGSGSSLSQSCSDVGSPDYSYRLQRSTSTPSIWQTGVIGANQPFSLMQPTKFIGSLFVYSGVMH
eukprot:689041_1